MNQESRIKKNRVKAPIVILHGWRVEGDRYKIVKGIFEKEGYRVFAPNLPGSGNEKIKTGVMTIDDYVLFVLDFFKKNKIAKAILVCHSFGGRVGAKLAAQYPEKIDKLILAGTPLIKQPLPLRKKILVKVASIIKKAAKNSLGKERMRKILYYLLGEWDYYKAPPEIQATFKAVIAEDISPNLPLIKAPTLVVWGENDTFVPKKVGKELAKRIPQGNYIEIPNATHKLPYENPEVFAKTVLNFLK